MKANMHIHARMNLSELAEHMGRNATEHDARAMRDLLAEYYDGMDTSDVPESEWLMALKMSHEIMRGMSSSIPA